MFFFSIKKFIVLFGVGIFLFTFLNIKDAKSQATCVAGFPNTYSASCPASPAAGYCSAVVVNYSRNLDNISLSFAGGKYWIITDPNLNVLFPSPVASSFFWVLKEKTSNIYYILIGDDDYIGGSSGLSGTNCIAGVEGDVCRAFLNDFIPIISSRLIGGATTISPIQRIGGPTVAGYTEIITTGPLGTINYIFADGNTYLNNKGWTYVDNGSIGGSVLFNFSFCISPPPPPLLACNSTNCSLAITSAPCACGTLAIVAADNGKYCCAGNNAVYNTQALCQVGVCAPPPPAVLPMKPVKVKLMAIIINGLINWFLALAAGLAILFLIIGGIRYIRSWGDSEQTEKAKKMVSYVVLGLVIILISYSVIITLDKIING